MTDKIKGLEENIQAYINKHPACKVYLSVQKLVEDSQPIKQTGVQWTVTVKHAPIDLL